MNTVCAMCPRVLTVRIKTVYGYVCADCYKSRVMFAMPIVVSVRDISDEEIADVVQSAVVMVKS